MSLTKKGSRTIVVDGQRFRWTVRKSPSYAQALGWSSLSFAVEAAEGLGRVLCVKLDRPWPDTWLLFSSGATPIADVPPITPAEVARFIRQALQSGWDPAKPGAPFRITELAQSRCES